MASFSIITNAIRRSSGATSNHYLWMIGVNLDSQLSWCRISSNNASIPSKHVFSQSGSEPSSKCTVFLPFIPLASDPLASLQTAMSTGEENDLVKALDNLLNNLGPRFSKVSAELFAKSMGSYRRLDLDID